MVQKQIALRVSVIELIKSDKSWQRKLLKCLENVIKMIIDADCDDVNKYEWRDKCKHICLILLKYTQYRNVW